MFNNKEDQKMDKNSKKNNKNTKIFTKIRLTRLIAFTAAMLLFLSGLSFPFAAKTANWTSRLDDLTGYGGAEYYKKSGYYVNIYGPGGVIEDVRYKAGGSRQRVYYLTNTDTGEEQTAYCLASGLSFSTGAGYGSDPDNGQVFAEYYENLPASAKDGIAFASIYGFNEKKMSLNGPGPVEGTLGSDFWMATQCIIWEYQQGIRTDAGLRRSKGQIAADNYYSIVKDKPAEKCYDYLLDLIKEASSVPTFAAVNESGWDKVVELSETAPESGLYELRIYSRTTVIPGNYYVTDEDGTVLPDVQLTVAGNSFRFTSTRKYEAGKRIIVRRQEDGTDEGAAVFFGPDDPGKQTMLSTAGRLATPFKMYLSIKTIDNNGEKVRLEIRKSSGDGIVEGVPFIYAWKSSDDRYYNRTVYTDETGMNEAEFRMSMNPGDVMSNLRYIAVMEQPSDRYESSLTSESGNIGFSLDVFFCKGEQNGDLVWKYAYSINEAISMSADGKAYPGHLINVGYDRENSVIFLDYYNDPLKGKVKLIKQSETGSAGGFVFELTGQDPENAGIVIRQTTGSDGIALWNDLLPGTYMIKEILPAQSVWEEPDPVIVTVEPDKTATVNMRNVLKKGMIRIVKTSEDGLFDGISFVVVNTSGFSVTVLPDEDSIQMIDGVPAFVALIGGLEPGTYTVVENAPARYKQQYGKIVSVESGRTAEVRFHNELSDVTLTIVKSIYAEEFIPAHGDATFIFRIRDVDRDKTYYRAVSFGAGDKQKGQSGLISKSISIQGLLPGTYEVTELKTLRYELESIVPGDGVTVSGAKAVYVLGSDHISANAEFINRVINQEKTTDTAFCENRFAGGK